MNSAIEVERASLRVREFARAIGLGEVKTYEYVMNGKIKSYTIGRRRLIPSSELVDFPARMVAEQSNAVR